jgi:hypothetical protein
VHEEIERDLNTSINNGGLLWRCRIFVHGQTVYVFWSFAHIMTDGFGAMSISDTFTEVLEAVLDDSFDAPEVFDEEPPKLYEENADAGCCSFLPALHSLIKYGVFDPRKGRFVGHQAPIGASMKTTKTTQLYQHEFSTETTLAFIAMCKVKENSVTSAMVAASLTASRSVFELNIGFADAAQDKQGFMIPANGRGLVKGGVFPQKSTANYLSVTIHPDFPIVDSDKFWATAKSVRKFMLSDAKHYAGRAHIMKAAIDKGQLFPQLQQYIDAGSKFPRAISLTMSSLGRIRLVHNEKKRVNVVNLWGASSLWFVSAATQFTVSCATINDKLRVMVTSPVGVITQKEAKVHIDSLKRVIERTACHEDISVGEARR